MNRNAVLPSPSRTSSTSSGSSSGMGTLQSVASTATRLASISALRCCKASRRISAQLSRSGMGVVLQPASQQRAQRFEGLIAIGQQRQLAMLFGKQRRKPCNTEVACPFEVRVGGVANGLRDETVGKIAARDSNRFGQVRQPLRPRHVTTFGVEGLLNSLRQRPGQLLVKTP